MTLLTLYIALAIGVSFLCSLLEACLLSITPTYTATIKVSRPRMAEKINELKDNIDRPLAAILSLNTVAHTVGAAGAGAQAAIVFGEASIAIFSAVLTLLILVFSEIIPKTLGAMYWKSFAPVAARILPVLIWSMWPLVKLSQAITRLLSRGRLQSPISREEIAAMADIGHREGVIDHGDSKLVGNLLRFDRLTVEDIMTPRTVIFALDQATTVGEAVARKQELRFSRIPIYDGSIDTVTGFILKTDLLFEALDGNAEKRLSRLRRDLGSVFATMSLEDLFDTLVHNDRHVALVVDAYGGTEGIVTLEDLIETLIGEEIVDELDGVADLQAYARKRWNERHARISSGAPSQSDADR
ncbi:MAG: hemolysin family protein [Hoeflea sp.]|uniref:CNNM domain-containing protein n=1 Tax=Hoeflea sp. TaxID=1940281 RepID=UPI00273093BC|nr:hemolysin family protein [Hoeflea sp.]MDP2121191.1 hemolysin family protein [Hoeflea sp.]